MVSRARKDQIPGPDEFPTITPEEWMNDAARASESRRLRRVVVGKFEEANGMQVGRILELVREGRLSVYVAAKRTVDHLDQTSSPYTVYIYRSQLADMLLSTLGERRFSRTAFNRIVTCASPYLVHSKKIPTREQVTEMLKMAQPLHRALIAILSVSGMRIGEALSRRWSDLEIREDGHAKVSIKAADAKSRYRRTTYLTDECVDFLKTIRNTDSEWLFSDRNGLHLGYNSIWKHLKKIFRRVGLEDSDDGTEVARIHSLRTFAGDTMRDRGLAERDVLLIVGHKNKLSADASYVDERKVEANWVKHCSKKMRFLSAEPLDYEQVKEENGDMKTILRELLAFLKSKG